VSKRKIFLDEDGKAIFSDDASFNPYPGRMEWKEVPAPPGTFDTYGKIYYQLTPLSRAELNARRAEHERGEENRKRNQHEQMLEQNRRLREQQAQARQPTAPVFRPGEETGYEHMQKLVEHHAKPVTALFRAEAEVRVRVGPKIPGVNNTKTFEVGGVGDADLSGRSVQVGGVEVTERGVVKRGVSVTTPGSSLGSVTVKVEGGVDVKESVVQGATKVVDSALEHPTAKQLGGRGAAVDAAVDAASRGNKP
jgi:hypothetical protein